MPNKILVLNAASIFLQYSLLALVYFFLYKVIKTVYGDMKKPYKHTCSTVHQQDNTPAQLRVIDTGNVPMSAQIFQIGESISIGRSSTNDIAIDDKFVSYEHACITLYNRHHWLSDLNSTNHTYLNGKIVEEDTQLRTGDIIKIGAVTLEYER